MVLGVKALGVTRQTMIRRAVIVAAGRGRRMGRLTEERPKCLLPVGGRTLLERTLDVLHRCGIDDISVVRGFCGERLRQPGVRWFENPRYAETNMVASLWCAREVLEEGFLFLYSDIVVTEPIIRKALADRADIGLVVDRQWRSQYEGRTDHPIAEAELVAVDPAGLVVRIGKDLLTPEQAYGEFIGVARLGEQGAATFCDLYEQLLGQRPERRRIHQAQSLEQAYFTDLVQALVDAGRGVSVIPIDGGWQEIDTLQDYEGAQRRWTS